MASVGSLRDALGTSFLMAGMPIIGALMMGSCVRCCVRRCRRNRGAKKAAAAAREIELSASK